MQGKINLHSNLSSTLQALNNKYQYTEIVSNTMNVLVLILVKMKHINVPVYYIYIYI
jgi:hypothetical protein